jgi:hypothetical protein
VFDRFSTHHCLSKKRKWLQVIFACCVFIRTKTCLLNVFDVAVVAVMATTGLKYQQSSTSKAHQNQNNNLNNLVNGLHDLSLDPAVDALVQSYRKFAFNAQRNPGIADGNNGTNNGAVRGRDSGSGDNGAVEWGTISHRRHAVSNELKAIFYNELRTYLANPKNYEVCHSKFDTVIHLNLTYCHL